MGKSFTVEAAPAASRLLRTFVSERMRDRKLVVPWTETERDKKCRHQLESGWRGGGCTREWLARGERRLG